VTRDAIEHQAQAPGLSSTLAGVTFSRCQGMRPKHQSLQNAEVCVGLAREQRGESFDLASDVPVASKITSRT
jgi:hypothetical protein